MLFFIFWNGCSVCSIAKGGHRAKDVLLTRDCSHHGLGRLGKPEPRGRIRPSFSPGIIVEFGLLIIYVFIDFQESSSENQDNLSSAPTPAFCQNSKVIVTKTYRKPRAVSYLTNTKSIIFSEKIVEN